MKYTVKQPIIKTQKNINNYISNSIVKYKYNVSRKNITKPLTNKSSNIMNRHNSIVNNIIFSVFGKKHNATGLGNITAHTLTDVLGFNIRYNRNDTGIYFNGFDNQGKKNGFHLSLHYPSHSEQGSAGKAHIKYNIGTKSTENSPTARFDLKIINGRLNWDNVYNVIRTSDTKFPVIHPEGQRIVRATAYIMTSISRYNPELLKSYGEKRGGNYNNEFDTMIINIRLELENNDTIHIIYDLYNTSIICTDDYGTILSYINLDNSIKNTIDLIINVFYISTYVFSKMTEISTISTN
jgi:hypothetical protein